VADSRGEGVGHGGITVPGTRDPGDATFAGIAALARAYAAGDLDPVDVVEAHLARLERLQPHLNAFRTVDAGGARQAATESSRRWAGTNPRSPLDGVPVSIKDIVAVAGWSTSSGSATTDLEHLADEDSPPVARLREAGAVLLGMTTTPEFGWKGMTDSPLCGVTANPWDLTRTPGGSSGGAGASLAAGVGTFAFGTDGGGSIRIPASYCGLVGLKPTTGRVPQHPNDSLFALVAGGPLARSVLDAATVLNELVEPDARDPWSLPFEGRDWRLGLDDGVRGMRIGVTTMLGGASVSDDEITSAVRRTADRLADLGAQVTEAGSVFDPLRPTFEAHWKAGFAHLLRAVPADRHHLLDPGFRSLAEAGMNVEVEEMYAAQVARTRLAATMRSFHASVDMLLTPTMPTLAPPRDTVYHSEGFDRWSDAVPFTVPFNLTGQPAASVPVAVSESGLPIGIQLVGSHHREDLVLRVARSVEAGAGFDQPHPRLRAAMAGWDATAGVAGAVPTTRQVAPQ